MKGPEDGGPVHPTVTMETVECHETGIPVQQQGEWLGLSIREYFAAAALTGLMSSEQNMVAVAVNQGGPQSIARSCFVLADAMLKERELRP